LTNKDKDIPYPFRIDVAKAEQLIGAQMPAYGSAAVPLAAASGHVLRQRILAERDQPPFDRATMDGIAVRSAAVTKGLQSFAVAGIQAAGTAALELTADDQCVEIMTGAPLPATGDTVIPVERITLSDGEAQLEAGYEAQAGKFVHRRASDHKQADCLLEPGIRIGGPEMAILTAAGQPVVEVSEQPSIAIISTGDELTDVGEPIQDFQIRSSNDRAIESCLQLRGCDRTVRSRLPDEPQALREQIAWLHDNNDVLILSGGVSMGKYDYVPAIMEELGIRVVFHKILQRPGLPMWFGVSQTHKPVFALPGNPVSTMVCCVRFVLPAIEAAMGLNRVPVERVQLAERIDFQPDLTWFLPVSLSWTSDGITLAHPKPTNTSGDFIGLRHTAGFIELPRGQAQFPKGFAANLYRW
jgi:molybdopterin molybdotransferase